MFCLFFYISETIDGEAWYCQGVFKWHGTRVRKKRGRGYFPRTSCLSVREEATSWQSPTTEVSTLHCGRFTTSPATRDWLESPSQCIHSWLRFYHCAVPLAHGSCLVSVHVYKGPDLTATLMACVSAGSGTLCDAPCSVVLDSHTLA